MRVCFIGDGAPLIMPVTPGSYRWSTGKRMETVRLSRLGDVYLPGGRTRFAGRLEFLLPARDYPWMEAGAMAEPQYYLSRLDAWALDEKPVRLVLTGTAAKAPPAGWTAGRSSATPSSAGTPSRPSAGGADQESDADFYARYHFSADSGVFIHGLIGAERL